MRIRIIYLMKNKYIMENNGTTSIDQLPINSQISSNNNSPVQLSITGLPQQQPSNLGESQNVKIENYGQQLNNERSIDTATQHIDYSTQLTSVLKEASMSGATVLPSRDIPQNTLPMQHDEQIKPNYVPDKGNDYIGDILEKEQIIKNNTKQQNQSDNLDYIYQQFQLPILVAIIYFIFQLPSFRKYIFSFLPKLFNSDGNPNLYGYVFNSVLFGALYYGLTKGLRQLTH